MCLLCWRIVPQTGLALMGFSRYCPSSLDLPHFVVRECRGATAEPPRRSARAGPDGPSPARGQILEIWDLEIQICGFGEQRYVLFAAWGLALESFMDWNGQFDKIWDFQIVPQTGLALMGFSRYCPSSLDLTNFVVRSCRGAAAEPCPTPGRPAM